MDYRLVISWDFFLIQPFWELNPWHGVLFARFYWLISHFRSRWAFKECFLAETCFRWPFVCPELDTLRSQLSDIQENTSFHSVWFLKVQKRFIFFKSPFLKGGKHLRFLRAEIWEWIRETWELKDQKRIESYHNKYLRLKWIEIYLSSFLRYRER